MNQYKYFHHDTPNDMFLKCLSTNIKLTLMKLKPNSTLHKEIASLTCTHEIKLTIVQMDSF